MIPGLIFCGILNGIFILVEIWQRMNSFELLTIVDTTIYLIFYAYIFICLYSLYDKIKAKNESKIDQVKLEDEV